MNRLSILALALAWAQAPAQDAAKAAQDAPPPAMLAQDAPKPQAPPIAAQAKPSAKNPVPQQGRPAKVANMQARQAPPVPKKPWMEFKLDPKSTLLMDFNEANPNTVISILSRASGITILKDPNFKNTLTITTAKALPLKDAFEVFNSVLNYSGYELHKKGDLMAVEKIPPPPPPQMAPPPPQPDMSPVPKIYKIQYANASQIAKVILDVFGASAPGGGQPAPNFGGGFPGGFPGGFQGGNPGGGAPPGGQQPVKATPEEYANSVVVFASPKQHEAVEKLIKELDQPNENPLDSEIYQIKHIPVEEVISAIKEVLVAQTPLGKGKAQESQQNQFSFRWWANNDDSPQKGAQSAIAVKQTNTVIVTATKANLSLIKKLIGTLDIETEYVASTQYVRLENAKASDVAQLLNTAFTKRPNNDNTQFFFFDGPQPKKNSSAVTDVVDGKVVNIRDLTGLVNVTADPNTNGLIVSTSPSNLRYVLQIVKQLDHIGDQVMIEAIIVEANLDKTTKLGAEFSLSSGRVLGNRNVTSTGGTNFGIKNSATTPQGWNYTITGTGYQWILNALQTDSKFKILSTPRIFASNNVQSEINVGQKVPYITSQNQSSTGSTFSNYQFENVGVVLTVTPRVASSGLVAMDVVQQANDVQSYTSFNAPLINNRSAKTTVTVADGETVVLGGIIRQSRSSTINKIPFFGDIPLIGELFKSSSVSTGQTELMVFLTPHIVHTPEDARKIMEQQTQELSKSSKKSVENEIGKGKP